LSLLVAAAEVAGSPVKTLRAGAEVVAYFKEPFLLLRQQVTQLQLAGAVLAEPMLVLHLTVTTLFLET
jgi:hypothetical protein